MDRERSREIPGAIPEGMENPGTAFVQCQVRFPVRTLLINSRSRLPRHADLHDSQKETRVVQSSSPIQ